MIYIYSIIMLNKKIERITILALALAVSAIAQSKRDTFFSDSLNIPRNLENFNIFQVDKWGPVTYSGEGKCDILDLYQRNVEQGLGYSTVVDYHYKQTKNGSSYTCISWGLGLSFKVVPDTSKYSQDHELPPNIPTAFSAKSQDEIAKLFESDSAFLEIESIKPVTYQAPGECHTIDFLFNMANEKSGFHGIVDIKHNELFSLTDGEKNCTFWGLAVKYKRRNVIEKVVTKKRIVEVIEIPPPKPDTVFVPVPTPVFPDLVPAEPKSSGCCVSCCNN